MFKFRVLNVMISVQRFPRILCCMCRPNKVIQGKIVSSRWKNTTYLAILVPVTPGAAEKQTHCCEDERERRHYCIQTTLRPPTLKWPGYICKRIETNNLYWLQSSYIINANVCEDGCLILFHTKLLNGFRWNFTLKYLVHQNISDCYFLL